MPCPILAGMTQLAHQDAPHLSPDQLTALASEYEAGIASEAALVERYQLGTVGKLRVLARKLEWVRGNLRGAIGEAADRAALAAVGRGGEDQRGTGGELDPWRQAAIDRYADVLADVSAQHRATIAKGHALTVLLMAELEGLVKLLAFPLDQLDARVAEIAAGTVAPPKGATGKGADKKLQNAALVRALLLRERASMVAEGAEIMARLSQSSQRWIELERQAFGMDKGKGNGSGGGGDGYEALLRAGNEGARR